MELTVEGWTITWAPIPQVYGSPAGNFLVKAWDVNRVLKVAVFTEDEAINFDPEAEWAKAVEARRVAP